MLKIAQGRAEQYRALQEEGLICRSGEFFPSVHYPPITMYPATSAAEVLAGYEPPADGQYTMYAHIPFCLKACAFCHYPVKFLASAAEMDHYLDTMEREMDLWRARLGVDRIKARSILVGGGTPTYLSPVQLDRFLRIFTSRLEMHEGIQFNFDVDPLTLIDGNGPERLRILRGYGVNRLTIGLQSLDDDTLARMNRHHDARQAVRSVHASREAGFGLNIEFIFGYPGETLESWCAVIQEAVTLPVDEIQIYRLKMIPYGAKTAPLTRGFRGLNDRLPSVDEVIMMKSLAHQVLNASGFHENLTRVFTRGTEFYSHYASDQCCGLFDQIGIGLTAFSSLRDRFLLNTQDFPEYYGLVADGKLPANRGIVRSHDEQVRWAVILPLKNNAVSKRLFQLRTGVSLNDVFRPRIERLKAFGLLEEDEAVLELTPDGRFFADEICQQFHAPEHVPFPREAYAEGPLSPYAEQRLDRALAL